MSSTNQKNALITGAAKRIGREIAMKLAKNGWNIAIHHNTSSPDEILAEIKSLGVEAISIQADLNNDAEVK
ncbi:MAG: short-chain dehydrogenase, partial [Alphaproteobacteria bacterium CG11_big_fil_rev_8_21_14_0_20_44_7]